MLPSLAVAQSTPSDKLLDLRLNWLAQLARQDATSWEIELTTAPRQGPTIASLGDPNAVLKELGPVLTDDYNVARNGLIALAVKAKARRDEMQKNWDEVYRQRIAFRQFADTQQAAYGFNLDTGTPPSFRVSLADLVLLVWGLGVFIVALRLRASETRLAIRKAQRAAAATILLMLTLVPGCSFEQDSARSWTEREAEDLAAAGKDASDKADASTATANARWQATVDAWAKLVRSDSGSLETTIQREEVGGDGQGLRDRLRAVATETRLTELLAKDAEDQRTKLADERTRLADLTSSARWRTVAMSVVRIGLAVGLFALTIAPFWSARRALATAVRSAARTCPRCFRRDTLSVERAGASAAMSRYRGPKLKAKPAATPGPEADPDADDDADVRCSKCGLRMRRSYLKVPRLCFPTVGVRSSGKTHMLVTAYDRIRKRTAPTAANIQPAPSGGDIDKRFDRLIEEILHRRGEAGATDLVLPDPVLVHLKDCDPQGGNAALVNLFDYSGELINPDVDVNQLKATAVRMDGFMLFLDPTQLYGDGANVSLDEQLGMLDQFLAHMRKERKVPVGEPIPVPVAVCVTKLDLLINENPIGGQSVPFIRQLVSQLSPPPREMTLDAIKARSDLVEEMLPLMFTGANVRQIIEGYFGGRVMFFPVSSVGLFEHELGVRDLAKRTISPFGVAEPLIWLMHMHGYEVLGDG